ncbi:hypothetical protein A2Z41_00255 [Microgenomates group bacterium RBG_19FT_COMBO_39_10]|nr:MAG: hypothetical protein A2Z41_00255 [Microgenomates group bacterium RBG_19FT_COMBO_39_10]
MESLEEQWKEFFGSGFYTEAWGMRTDYSKTKEQVDGVLNLLGPVTGSHILDWCGGWGRHSFLLAQLGYQVTLLDFAPNHIQRAKNKLARKKYRKLKIKCLCKDFRETPPEIQADFAINMFTSGIGYLTQEDDLKALQSLNLALKPKAKFLLDTMNLFWIVKNYQSDSGRYSPKDERVLVEKRNFNFLENRNVSEIFYFNGLQKIETKLDHRLYSALELINLLKQADFETLEVYGDFDGSPYNFDSKRLIIISQKN